jgi:hypothetical protein
MVAPFPFRLIPMSALITIIPRIRRMAGYTAITDLDRASMAVDGEDMAGVDIAGMDMRGAGMGGRGAVGEDTVGVETEAMRQSICLGKALLDRFR